MSKQLMTCESLFEFSTMAEPVVYQDKIFYIETSLDQAKNQYIKDICAYDIHKQSQTPWNQGGSSHSAIEISKCQNYLLFLSNQTEDEKNQLFRMPLCGGAAQQITFESEGVTSYIQANDSSIYYQTNQKREDQEELEEDFPSEITIDKVMYKLDSQGIFIDDKDYQLKKLDVDSLCTEIILDLEQAFQVSFVNSQETYLLYSINDREDEWKYGRQLYLYDMQKKTQQVIATPGEEGELNFKDANPSQTHLLFVGNDFEYSFVTLQKLYVYEVDTGELKPLHHDLDKFVGDFMVSDSQQNSKEFPVFWLSDDEYIFPTTHHGKIQLYRGNLSGQHQLVFDQAVHLTGGATDLYNGKLIVTYTSFTQPSQLASIDLETGTLVDLFNCNQNFEEKYLIQDAERFWYTNSDQIDIQGWYVAPHIEAEKVPAILYVHGGPQVCYGESFFHEMQYLASKGYGVIMLNPRGGNGYGQEFVASILGEYGQKDYRDLMEGLDFILEKHPEIDHQQLFVAGGSYGGFMTNWIVGHNQRFCAAASQRSISNWISFYGTSDIGPFFVKFQLLHELDQLDVLWDMSPLKFASQVKTPLLLLHGQEDLRCPQEQAEQMYTAVKRQNVESKLILFPKSSHGLSRNGLPNLRMARMKAIIDWFDKHRTSNSL